MKHLPIVILALLIGAYGYLTWYFHNKEAERRDIFYQKAVEFGWTARDCNLTLEETRIIVNEILEMSNR